MREVAFEQLNKSKIFLYRMEKVSGSYIQNLLFLPDKDDCFNCLEAYGFSPGKNTCDFDPRDRTSVDQWKQRIQKYR